MPIQARLRHFPMRGAPFIAERTALLAITQGRVLELCVDANSNLPYFSPWVSELAQVSLDGRPPGREQMTSHRGMPLQRICLSPEHAAFPFSDAEFDWVVSTLTLCRLRDAPAALREVRRVLKPGGAYMFLEHGVSADPTVRRWQRTLDPIWPSIAGCRIACEIDGMIRDAGFDIAALDRYHYARPAALSSVYRGRATRA